MKLIRFVKKDSLLPLFYILYMFLVVLKIIYKYKIGYAKESWQITEWMINYQGGFVRRGFWGEILFNLYERFGINPYYMMLGLSLLCFILLTWFFASKFIKNGFPLVVLSLVFFLGGPVINYFLVRKDLLLILLFIASLYFALRESRFWVLLPMNIFLIIGLLTHEAIGFFGIPVVFLVLFSKQLRLKQRNNFLSFVVSGLQLFPALLSFLAVLYFKGTEEVSWAIWNSWDGAYFPVASTSLELPPNAVGAIGWSIKEALIYPLNTITRFEYGIYAPLALLFVILFIYYLMTHLKLFFRRIPFQSSFKEFDKVILSRILLFQFLMFIPLFMLGWDYGRLVFQWISVSVAIYLLVPHDQLMSLFPRFMNPWSEKLSSMLEFLFNRFHRILIFMPLLIGFPQFSWSLQGYLFSTPLIYTIRTIISMIKEVI